VAAVWSSVREIIIGTDPGNGIPGSDVDDALVG